MKIILEIIQLLVYNSYRLGDFMRLTLAQLNKISYPYIINEELDLKSDLIGFEDIIDSSIVKVINKIYQNDINEYKIYFDISLTLTVLDSISLKPIKLDISSSGAEIFSTNPKNEDAFYIENQTLDTKEAVIMLILSEKPMSTTTEVFESDEDDNIEDDDINPAFASLKDLL